MIQRAILLKFDAYLGSVSESWPYEFNILDNMLWFLLNRWYLPKIKNLF